MEGEAKHAGGERDRVRKSSVIRKDAIVTCLVVAVAVLLISKFSNGKIWLGEIRLTVHLHSKHPSPIRAVSFDDRRRTPGCDSVEQYEWDGLRSAEELAKSDFLVRVKCTGRDDGWGREISYGQCDLVLLQIEFEDGKIVRKLVDVPEGRGPREVDVQVP